MIKFNVTGELEPQASSGGYIADALSKVFDVDPDVMYLDADLAGSVGTIGLFTKYPGRAFDCGIQEADMVGVAAGLSLTGKKPYIHTFAAFATRRVFDQLYLSVGYAGASVKIFGSDPGFTAGVNGGTHMSFEDMALVRTIPGATVIDITDHAMMYDIFMRVRDIPGVVYMRMPRKFTKKVYEMGSEFPIGKGFELKDGKDVTIIASGLLVTEAYQAAQILDKEGISAQVINIYTIKPLDREMVVAAAKKTGAIVTAENHGVIGGLGAAVCECLAEECPTPVLRIGAQDRFGEVGPDASYLYPVFKMTAEDIAEKAREVIKLKK